MHNNSTYVGLGEVVGWQLKPMTHPLGKRYLPSHQGLTFMMLAKIETQS